MDFGQSIPGLPGARPFPPNAPYGAIQRAGFAVFSDVELCVNLHELHREALQQASCARETFVQRSDAEEVRGGQPARRFLSSPAGPALASFYHSPVLLGRLRQLIAPTVRPTGSNGTYTYYTRPGDFIGIHRDVEYCDIAVITCLDDNSPDGKGGALCLYPARTADLLSAIRRDPVVGVLGIKLARGQTIAFTGGMIPHAILPVSAGQRRIVAVLCYQF